MHIHIHTFTNIYTQKHTHQTYTLSKPTTTYEDTFVCIQRHTHLPTHTHTCMLLEKELNLECP